MASFRAGLLLPAASCTSLSRWASSLCTPWTRPAIMALSCGSVSTWKACSRAAAAALSAAASPASSPGRGGGGGEPGPPGAIPGGKGNAPGGGPAIGPSADMCLLLVCTRRAGPVFALLDQRAAGGHAPELAEHLDAEGERDHPVVVAARHGAWAWVGLGVDEGAQLGHVPGRDPGEEALAYPVLELVQHLLAALDAHGEAPLLRDRVVTADELAMAVDPAICRQILVAVLERDDQGIAVAALALDADQGLVEPAAEVVELDGGAGSLHLGVQLGAERTGLQVDHMGRGEVGAPAGGAVDAERVGPLGNRPLKDLDHPVPELDEVGSPPAQQGELAGQDRPHLLVPVPAHGVGVEVEMPGEHEGVGLGQRVLLVALDLVQLHGLGLVP